MQEVVLCLCIKITCVTFSMKFPFSPSSVWHITLHTSKPSSGTGVVAYACNTVTLGSWGGRTASDQSGQHGETPISTKSKKISWIRWCTSVVPTTPEAEVGESPELGRSRLQWAVIVPLHSSLTARATSRPCL